MNKKEILLKKKQELIYQEYLNLINSKENILVGIEKMAIYYNTDSDTIIKILSQYIDTYIKKPDYAIIFDNLKIVKNKNEYLKNLGITPNYLKSHLHEYLLFYNPKVILKNNRRSEVFQKIIKNYENYLRGPKLRATIEEVRPIIEEFIKSEYGIERFCIKYHLSYYNFNFNNGIFITALKRDPLLYKRFLDNLDLKEKIKYEHIEDDISIILDYIHKLGDDFSLIDLFQITKYGPYELLNFANEYLQGDELKLFRKFIGKSYRNFVTTGSFMNKSRIKALITAKYIFTIDDEQIETTEEFRSEIINFLMEKDIPINSEIFHTACVRHYNGNLITKVYR